MSATPQPRVRMPATAKAGEIVEVKLLLSGHDMESGQRKDKDGRAIPRKIVNQLVVSFEGEEMLRVEMFPAVAANPYHAFFVRVPKSGIFRFSWRDDDGTIYNAEHKVTVG